MRLTSREKVMLIGFIVVLIITGAIYYLYLPTYDLLQKERQSHENNRQTLANIERNILPIDQQMKLIDTFRQKVELMQKVLPPKLYQEDVLRKMTKVFDENKIEVTEYVFGSFKKAEKSDETQVALDKILSGYEDTMLDNFSKGMVEARFENAESTENDESEGWENIVSTIDVTVSISGEYERVKNAIVAFENFENLVLVNNMSLAKDINRKNIVLGTLDLKFPYYYDNEVLERLDWLYESNFEEHMPFNYIVKGSLADPDRPIINTSSPNFSLSDLAGDSSYSGINQSIFNNFNSGTVSSESTELKPDFELVMSAPTSINNNYFISKADQRDLSLYSRREAENITLTITESAGKLSFAYSTSFTSFPGVNEYYSFTPNYEDAVYVTVVSTPRVDEKDVGMGTVNVINKSTRPIKIFVKSDDVKIPRFVLGEQEGLVQVIY